MEQFRQRLGAAESQGLPAFPKHFLKVLFLAGFAGAHPNTTNSCMSLYTRRPARLAGVFHPLSRPFKPPKGGAESVRGDIDQDGMLLFHNLSRHPMPTEKETWP
jgi:hypothetical protein